MKLKLSRNYLAPLEGLCNSYLIYQFLFNYQLLPFGATLRRNKISQLISCVTIKSTCKVRWRRLQTSTLSFSWKRTPITTMLSTPLWTDWMTKTRSIRNLRTWTLIRRALSPTKATRWVNLRSLAKQNVLIVIAFRMSCRQRQAGLLFYERNFNS